SSRRPPLRLASPLSHQTWAEDFHLQAVKHARHTRPCGRTERAHKGLGKLHKAQFSTASTPIIFFLQEEAQERRRLQVCQSDCFQQRGSPHRSVSVSVSNRRGGFARTKSAKCLGKLGEPGGNRTPNPQIKSSARVVRLCPSRAFRSGFRAIRV